MSDQAERLRHLVESRMQGAPDMPLRPDNERETRVITVTSGKGGVGKSNFTLNFSIALQQLGYRVLIFDADIGLANIDVLMGLSPNYSLYHLLKKEKSIFDIVQIGYGGVRFIAGGSGFTDLLRLSESELNEFAEQVSLLNGHFDYILFDTGAGLSKETMKFILAAHETFVVTTPEPTSLTDGYAIIKMVHQQEEAVQFRLVINRVTDEQEGKATAEKISLVAKRFLDIDIPTLGYVTDDSHVSRAVRRQIPFTAAYPNSDAAREIMSIAERYAGMNRLKRESSSGIKGFLSKMLRLLNNS
ncbi:MinD/ParA family protein [Gorillibacterium timonense]|uniref:MinD/ParA family protein n=1 Tax=Gorillibacterium timonense TaxID=1689269 RepID=UPI00071D50EB|nr:MinD/ParA family protein [Gorillibacterium timonense]